MLSVTVSTEYNNYVNKETGYFLKVQKYKNVTVVYIHTARLLISISSFFLG